MSHMLLSCKRLQSDMVLGSMALLIDTELSISVNPEDAKRAKQTRPMIDRCFEYT